MKNELKEGDWIFVDENVRKIYNDSLVKIISNFRSVAIKPVESSKSFDSIRPLLLELIEGGFKKNNRIIAIGGGITQDVTAFIASILYRGVSWIFFPSNLLSQCDSCIGSKTSINFGEYKNQLGGFYPPTKIYIGTNFLRTLDDIEICSGLGEMAHYFLVKNEDAFVRYERCVDDALRRGSSLNQLIAESLAIKKNMIELDEFDEGPRNIFNYGHSFGHAIEGYTKYAIPHGIAVSYGMDIANAVSVHYGFLSETIRLRISKTLCKVRRQTGFPNIDVDAYLNYLKKDKKNIGTDIRLILTKGFGDMFLTKVEPSEDFKTVVANCFKSFQEEKN